MSAIRRERAVAGALGHTSPTTTYRSYAKAEAVEANRQRRVIEVIEPAEWGTEAASDRSPAFPIGDRNDEGAPQIAGAPRESVELRGIEPLTSRVRF